MASVNDAEDGFNLAPSSSFHLKRVGSHFDGSLVPDQASLSAVDSEYGALADLSRLSNDIDEFIQAPSPISRTPTLTLTHPSQHNDEFRRSISRDSPVLTFLGSKCIELQDHNVTNLEELVTHKEEQPGSSLAPPSSTDGSINEKKHVGESSRPSREGGVMIMPFQRIQPSASHDVDRTSKEASISQGHTISRPQVVEDSFRCSECGKEFTRKSDLVHHKRYHTRSTDRPYKCDICGQGFIHYKDLARHMPRHTGQRSFQCPFQGCAKTYTRKDNLNRHMRHDHADVGSPGQPTDIPDQGVEETANDSADSPYQQAPGSHAIEMEAGQSSTGSNFHSLTASLRETTPTTGKRSADELEKSSNNTKPKRKPKEKWAHRLGCPFRKCRRELFTSELGYRVCETTPHEFIIRLVEHMKRNHDLYVCGDCFLGFTSLDFLTQHKDSFEHCSNCYLSFADKDALSQHNPSCFAVDFSSQEDIWQIMYETLCADGHRHNPSFDDDRPFDKTIGHNNKMRMDFLTQQPLQQGQLPPLHAQLGSSPGNGNAPPASNPDERSHQRLVPVGASSPQQISPTSHELYRPPLQILQDRGPVVYISNPILAQIPKEVLVAHRLPTIAVEQAISQPMWLSASGAETPKILPFAVPSTGNGLVVSVARPHVAIAPPLKRSSSGSSFNDIETLFSLYRDSSQPRRCPSLTSESTLQTQDQFGAFQDIPTYPSSGLANDPNNAIREKEQSFEYNWGLEQTPICMECGRAVELLEVFCESCIRRDAPT